MKNDKHTISIVGDVTKKEKYLYKSHLKIKLEEIGRDSHNPPTIITPLITHIDRLSAYIAMELGLEFEVLLPMPRELLVKDFDDASLIEFDSLMDKANSIDTVPLYWDNTLESISEQGIDREYQYMELRRILARESDEMIVLWGRVESCEFGSTAHIATMRRDDYRKPLYIVPCET